VEELRLFQLHQTQSGAQPPSINSAVSALRFFFTVTLERPDLSRRLTVVPYPRRIPTVLSVEEVRLLLQAASAPQYTSGCSPLTSGQHPSDDVSRVEQDGFMLFRRDLDEA
jgi:integrase/recombinase XerD